MKVSTSADHGFEQEMYRLLTDLFYLLDDTDRQFFGEYGLSTRQFWALHHLNETDGLSMIDLSRLLFTDKSNITAIADRLEGANLIKRSPAPQDRRMTLLILTPEGRQRHDEVFAAHQERIRSIIGGDEATLRQVIQHLERIHVRLEQHLDPDTSRSGSSRSGSSQATASHPTPASATATT
ncbi:MAG TPA: MarR family transcriptional regulator [Ktedonobacterales bacterium]